MLEKSTYIVSLWKFKDGFRSDKIEASIVALTAGEAMKKAEKNNPGYDATAARVCGNSD